MKLSIRYLRRLRRSLQAEIYAVDSLIALGRRGIALCVYDDMNIKRKVVIRRFLYLRGGHR